MLLVDGILKKENYTNFIIILIEIASFTLYKSKMIYIQSKQLKLFKKLCYEKNNINTMLKI